MNQRNFDTNTSGQQPLGQSGNLGDNRLFVSRLFLDGAPPAPHHFQASGNLARAARTNRGNCRPQGPPINGS
jgi:hypothetical protein